MTQPPTPGDALRELRALMQRGVTFDRALQGPPPGTIVQTSLTSKPVRRSAVLILFGALDQVPAGPLPHASATTRMITPSPRVSPALDVLLTRRAAHMRHHPGQIAFPGGGAEPGDAHAAATALREAQEETGLDPAGVEVLGQLPEIPLPVSNNLVTPVIGWWHAPSEVAADHTESVDVFRVPVAELLDPAARGTSILRTPQRARFGPAFALAPQLGGHIAWGFTGYLLAQLFDELGWAGPWDARRELPVKL